MHRYYKTFSEVALEKIWRFLKTDSFGENQICKITWSLYGYTSRTPLKRAQKKACRSEIQNPDFGEKNPDFGKKSTKNRSFGQNFGFFQKIKKFKSRYLHEFLDL